MKTKKKIWLIVALLMCFFQIQAQDFRAISDDSDFEVVEGVLVAYHGTGGDVVIPDHLGITVIGDAFGGNTAITSVVIPNGVTIIGAAAFVYCANLSSVIMPNSLEMIDFRAFEYCSALTSISIPVSVTFIGERAFSNCSGLTSIFIPNLVEYIGAWTFTGCSQLSAIYVDTGNLSYLSEDGILYNKDQTVLYCYPEGKSGTEFTIPDLVTDISTAAFYNCNKLTSIVLPNTVAYIRYAAFQSCSNLISITIPNLVVIIEDRTFDLCYQLSAIHVDGSNAVYSSIDGVLYNKDITTLIRYPEGKSNTIFSIPNTVTDLSFGSFYNCKNLTSITMPNTVEFIGIYAFAYCDNLASIVLSNSVVSIGNNAFESCTSLVSITIPNSVETVGDNIFIYCSQLTAIHVDEGNANFSSKEGVFYNQDQTVLYCYPEGKRGVFFSIPNSVKEIYPWGLYNTKIVSVAIPNSVETIGDYAFANCISLEDITVYWETPIIIPNNVFQRWYEEPYNLYVPVGSTEAYAAAVEDWSNDFIITEQEPPTGISLDITTAYIPVDYTVQLTVTVSPRNATTKNVTWSSDAPAVATVSATGLITAISEGMATITATTEEGGLEATCEITVANADFTVINGVLVAYRGTGGNVVIPDNLRITEIGMSVFENNNTIASVSIPEGVTIIDIRAFYNSSLTDVSIPSSVISIGDNVFEGCSNLLAINVNAENSNYSSQDGVLYNFYKSVLLFYPDRKTGSFALPNSVMIIGERAFSNCSGLTSVRIPNSIMSIGGSAFTGCSQLSDITVCWAPPLRIDANVFDGFNTNSCTLHVPEGTKTDYESDDVWKNFGTIIDDVPFIAVSGIMLNKTAVTLFMNDTEQLIAVVSPEDATNVNVNWSSSNSSVVTVSAYGLLTVMDEGTARITVETEDGNYTANCDVTVRQPMTIAWQGGNDAYWDNSLNWQYGQIPASKDIVKIPGSAINFPVLTELVTVDEIYFAPGAQIGRQSLLRGKAFISYDLSVPERWHMLSMPLHQAYPGDFTFGGYPLTWVRTFMVSESNTNEGSITKGSWVTARRVDVPFTAGDGFVLWLNEDNTTVDKGLKLLEGIHELPFFHHQAATEGSDERILYDKVHPMHEYNGGEQSIFYNFNFNEEKMEYERIEDEYYTVVRNADAYRLAGTNVFKSLYFGENEGTGGSDFNLIGNPYMACLDFGDLYTTNTDLIKSSYHIWTDYGYETYVYPEGQTGIIRDIPLSQFIAPLQGFIIEKPAGLSNGSLRFEEWMTTTDNEIILRSSTSIGNRLDIIARNPVAGVRTFIAKREGGQDEFCDLDARKIMNGISDVPEIYTLKPYNDGLIAVGANFINNDELLIPVGLATNYAGNITLSFTGMDNYDAKLSLLDTEINNEIDLTGLASYDHVVNYTPNTLNGIPAVCEDRFFIRISKTTTGLNETVAENVNVYKEKDFVRVISSAANPIKEVAVYSLQGTLLHKTTSLNTISHTVNMNWPAGMYIVKVISEKSVDNFKVIM